MSLVLTETTLRQAISNWLDDGIRVAGPIRAGGIVTYAYLDSADSLLTRGFIRPVNSIKQFFLPRSEVLFSYSSEARKVRLASEQLPNADQVIVAARPCDAAALPILDHVFNWDYQDRFYNHRRQRTTVITMACQDHDEHCFCTSVGLGPCSQHGSDAMLVPIDNEHFEVRYRTERGRRRLSELLLSSELTGTVGSAPELRFSIGAVQRFLDGGFEHDFWTSATLRCLGCGACSHNCPTCHCFDIVDQGQRGTGRRIRNWDSCQMAVYSLHASGHNPRATQVDRQRNRIFHKYHTYPNKFGDLLCTGCGTCSRNCPVSLGTCNVLEQIQNISPAGNGCSEQTNLRDSSAGDRVKEGIKT
jgi:ferredoxin